MLTWPVLVARLMPITMTTTRQSVRAIRTTEVPQVMERRTWVEIIRGKLRPPLAVALGSPGEVAELLAGLQINEPTCYQMDLYQAHRLRAQLKRRNVAEQL